MRVMMTLGEGFGKETAMPSKYTVARLINYPGKDSTSLIQKTNTVHDPMLIPFYYHIHNRCNQDPHR